MMRYFFYIFLSLTIVLVSCLLPAPVNINEVDNHRPFILADQAKPAKASVELNLNCSRCTFSLQEDDPDRQDTLYSRWFIDYDEGQTAIVCNSTIPPPFSESGERNLDKCSILLNQRFNSLASENTMHTIEVMIADRPFTDADDTKTQNRTLPQGAMFTVHRWNIKLVTNGTRCVSPLNICTEE